MGVKTVHPCYEKAIARIKFVRAICEGPESVREMKTDILPAPGMTQNGVYDQIRYAAYQKRAIFMGVTGRTQSGLTGAAFLKPWTKEQDFPEQLAYLETSCDGAQMSIGQLAKSVFFDLLASAREIILVDYPEIEKGLTREQIALLAPQASFRRYAPDCLINWKTAIIGGREVLTLAVLAEEYDDSTEEFEHKPKIQHRVLRLRDGVYTQEVYRDGVVYQPETESRDYWGSTFAEIPMVIIGSQSNDAAIDKIPLEEIAEVNAGHYRNSADLEDNAFQHGQMTAGVSTDLDGTQWTESNPNGIQVGARVVHYLGPNGKFETMQADPNQLLDSMMERKEGQMIALGARLIEDRESITATQVRVDATGQNSILGDLVSNLEEAIWQCIEWAGRYMGVEVDEPEKYFKLSRQFFNDSVDPQVITAAIQLFDRKIIAGSDLKNVARKADIISDERTDDDIDQEINNESPISSPDTMNLGADGFGQGIAE